MIIEQRIKDYEAMGLGMFVHFGLYSVIGKGEWAKKLLEIPWEEYKKTLEVFCPKEDWAEELVLTAKAAGCRYITLTSRHHDGFSLYDTCGMNTYDAPHICGRDLVREFVDACNRHGIIPFFYHTLLDWHEESYESNFTEYLKYLRKSVELVCKNYGKIGGIWFDGMWDKPDADWEEDALYGMIRSHQPQAMIINNTGLSRGGALGHIELDSVTFERGRPNAINLETSPKYVASEMCEILGDHWGYADMDFNFKSTAEIIRTLALCRRYRANLLYNVGPKADGSLRLMDQAALEVLGKWVSLNEEALRDPEPYPVEIVDRPDDFILKKGNHYYLFIFDLPMVLNENVTRGSMTWFDERFQLPEQIKSAVWLDNGKDVPFTQEGDQVVLNSQPFAYGENLVVRIAKITV